MSGLFDYSRQDMGADLRAISRARGVTAPTHDDLRELGRSIIRKVVPSWRPGQRLTVHQEIRLGEFLEGEVRAARAQVA